MFTASAPGLYLFAAQCPTPPILYLRFAANLTVGLAQDSRPSGSLLLSCKALSSSTFMPVYPGAQTSGLHSSSVLQGKRLWIWDVQPSKNYYSFTTVGRNQQWKSENAHLARR